MRCSAPWRRRYLAASGEPAGDEHVPIGRVLALAEAEQPSRLPSRRGRPGRAHGDFKKQKNKTVVLTRTGKRKVQRAQMRSTQCCRRVSYASLVVSHMKSIIMRRCGMAGERAPNAAKKGSGPSAKGDLHAQAAGCRRGRHV